MPTLGLIEAGHLMLSTNWVIAFTVLPSGFQSFENTSDVMVKRVLKG
jgi:predicted secreted protein